MADSSWLKLAFSRAERTRSTADYRFLESDETGAPIPLLNMEQIARRIEDANSEVERYQQILREAQNHVVECEAELIKAETFRERQNEMWNEEAKRRGLPCQT